MLCSTYFCSDTNTLLKYTGLVVKFVLTCSLMSTKDDIDSYGGIESKPGFPELSKVFKNIVIDSTDN